MSVNKSKSSDVGEEDVTTKKDDTAKKSAKKRTRRDTRQGAWNKVNAKYVERSVRLFELIRDLANFYHDEEELAIMNYKKRGRPYRYTNSFIAALSRIRDVLAMDFRACEGMAHVFTGGNGPEFTTIFRRINSMDAHIRDSLSDTTCENVSIDLVPDGTGLTPATRSEYIRVVHKLKRGFLRLTIMINKDTLEIMAFELTDDKVGEPTVFESVLENSLINIGIDPDERRRVVLEQAHLKEKTYTTITLTADGGYDSREIFSACKKLGIATNIRIRKNANIKADGVDRARSEAVLAQLGGGKDVSAAEFADMNESKREENRKKWKKSVKYGTRWLVEIVISAFKRTYGSDVMAKKLSNIRQEIRLKIRTYNEMLRIGREAFMKA